MQTTLTLLILLTGLAVAQPLPQAGQVYQTRKCDLNGDGKPERVELVAYRIQRESDSHWGQLRVVSSAGKLLWKGPQASTAGEAFAFGSWPYGVSDLEWLGDVDGDGQVDLLSPAAISDVRPTTYRRYRWTGSAFEAMPKKMLLEKAPGSGQFVWTDPINWDGQKPLTWVMSLAGSPDLIATVYSWRRGGEGWIGKAKMVGSPTALKVSQWLNPLKATGQ